MLDSRRPSRASWRAGSIDVDTIVRDPLAPVVGVVAIAFGVLLVALIVLAVRVRRLSRRLEGLTRGADGNLEAVLDAHLRSVADVSRTVDELEARAAVLERDLRRTVQRIGLVRFNPFEDTGGNQSFALALLDGNADGVVLSSLHARAGTRVYAKSLASGRSEASLSAEESQALEAALGRSAGPAPHA